MCGIIGTNFKPNGNFLEATQLMENRGPDHRATKSIEDNHLGHTRLSIIDLDSEANQPLEFDDILIVFNGEIYNYKELIKDEKLQVSTKSDTEVIIRLYQKYQENFLNKLNGAFSFSIYDKKLDKFFCARDRYGKKPFFYYFKDKKFIFSSMIKPIIKLLGFTPKLNKIALSQYLQYFVPLAPNTFYTDILKLDAGSYVTIQNGELITKKYYKINTYKHIKSEDIALEKVEDLLFQSVEQRLVSDVEVGSLLSGGIDSSLVSTLYSQISGKTIKTYSVGYEGFSQYSELPYAQLLANNIKSDHTPLVIDQKDYIESLDDVIDSLEEPHADPASVPLYLLTKEINNQGIKTVFSGEGSDELFLGYDNYAKFLKYYNFKDSLQNDQVDFLDDIIGALQTQTKESEYLRRVIKGENIYNSFGEIYTQAQKKKLFKKCPNFKSEKAKKDPIDWMSYIDLKVWLGEALLSKVDKISMANSVETRNPFLDFRLVDTVFGINSDIKIGDTNKYLLKKIAAKYIPQEIINRPKKGFNSPFNEWLFAEYKGKILEDILSVNKQTGFFNEEYVKFIYTQGEKNKFKQHLYALWLFSKWYKKNF